MSTTISAAPRRAALGPGTGESNRSTASSSAAAASTDAVDSDEMRGRGQTVIADKVFEKIAGQAASEVATSRGRTGGVLGIGSDANAAARPKVDVDLSADSVDLDLAVGIAYPGSIRTAAQQIRQRVSDRVHELTGVPVHRVDIDVTFLTTPTRSTSPGGQRHLKGTLR